MGRPARKKIRKIEEFDRKARENGGDYAEEQIKETLKMVEHIVIPKGYKKAGERKKENEQ